MKYFFIYLFLIISCSQLFADESQFRFINQELNFRGVVNTGTKIICYGDYGSILTSTDLGKSWEQTRISDYRDTIVKLYYFNNNILGFTKSGKNIFSNDNGTTWSFTQNQNIQNIKAITKDSNYFYIREPQNLKVFDFNFQLIAILNDTLINTSNSNEPSFLCVYDDKVYFNAFNYDVISIPLKDLLNSNPNFKFNKFADSIRVITSMCINKNKLLTTYFSKKQAIFSEITITDLNSDTSIFKSTKYAFFNSYSDSNYFALIDYEVNEYEKGKYNNINIYKFNNVNNDFVKIGNSSKNASYLGDIVDLYIDYLDYTPRDYCRINDSTIIIVAKYKTIYITNNNGISWDLVSTYTSPFYSFFFDNGKEYYFKGKCDMFNSSNSGQTFSTNLYDSLLFSQMNKLGLSNPSNLVMDSTGKTIGLCYTQNDHRNAYFIKSNDFGKTFLLQKADKIQSVKNSKFETKSIISKLDDNYVFSQSSKDSTEWLTRIYKLDSNLNVLSSATLNNNRIVHFIDYDKNNKVFLVNSHTDSVTNNMYLNFTKSSDGLKSFVDVFSLRISNISSLRTEYLDKTKDTLILLFSENFNDTSFFQDHYILRYIISSNKLDTLYFENSKSTLTSLMNFQSKLYVVGYEFFLETKRRDNLFDWKRSNAIGTNWYSVTSSDFGFYHVYYSSQKYPGGFYKIYLDNINSVHEVESEKAAKESNIIQSTHIELYDILGRSIATFTSYEKLKEEIENYPPPHLIKWRDEKGIFHYEKMK